MNLKCFYITPWIHSTEENNEYEEEKEEEKGKGRENESLDDSLCMSLYE